MSSKIEDIKRARDGLEVGVDIPRYQREGWQAIPEDDRDVRLKWWGIFYRKQTPGHFMIRIRIPNGLSNARQVRAIGEIANHFGRGTLDITTRQQVQLRWIRIEDVPAILDRLRAVGLVTLQTGMDNLRNVVGCPVAGLTPNELFDASPVARAFTEIFVGNRQYTNLPRKMNVTITGCKENCTHAETQDIALVPATRPVDGRLAKGFNILVGGKMGSGGYRVASPLDVFVRPQEAPEVVAALVRVYRDHGPRDARNRCRLAFLVEDRGEERLRRATEERLSRALMPSGQDARFPTGTDHIGVFPQRQPGLHYVGLLATVGRVTGDQFLQLARLAEAYGNGEVRFTVNQNVILPNVPETKLDDLLGEPLLQELGPRPSAIRRGTVACTGTDFCSLALIETKGQALNLIGAIERSMGETRPLTVHWSGCPAGCGQHQAADIGFIGRRVRVNGEVIDAVDIFVGGSSGPAAVPGMKIMESVPVESVPAIVELLTRHGDFKQMREHLRDMAAQRPAPATARQPVEAVPV